MTVLPETADPKFPAIARASILSGIENKHTQYIAMADRKAQGLLTISAVLAPVAISRISDPDFFPAIAIFLFGMVVTIIASALCMNPKRFRRINADDQFLLHFSHISRQERSDYLARMSVVMDDTSKLAEEVSKDLYHLSHDVLIPKFRWLRIAYASFVASLCISVSVIVYQFAF